MSDLAAHDVIMSQADAIKRGALTMWTIYDSPSDHPEGFIARRFEIDGEIRPTDDVIVGELEDIRSIFCKSGLMKLSRQDGDQRQVVESWV
jgi:hypothetical protein